MADFVATAFVRIQSELDKGFRANLKSQITKSIGTKPISVPITASIAPFRQKLQQEVRRSPILVPIRPEVAIGKFRAELKTKVDQAARGVIVRIPVEAGATIRGAGGVATRGATGAAATTKTLTEAEKALAREEKLLTGLSEQRAAAQTRLTNSLRQNLGVEFQLAQTKAGLKAVEKGLTAGVVAEAAARTAGRTALADELALRNAALTTIGEELAAKKASIAASVETTTLNRSFAASQTAANEALAVNVKEIRSRSALADLNNKFLTVESDLHALNAKAIDVENAAMIRNTEVLLANIAERKGEIATQRQQLASQSHLGTQVKAARRGAFATALTAVGARGATLAAGGEFLAGAAAVAITAKAISSAADLEKQLNILRITSRATAEQMDEVGKAALDLGRDVSLPGVSAGDAAKTILQLSKAGLTLEDAISGAKGTLQLATAAEIDFAEAGQLVASALNAFSLSGSDAIHVADLLTNAANQSQAEITDMGISLQQSAAAASLVGVSLDDTVALLTLLSRAGLSGSDAGTSLRVAFIKLINPTKKANEILEKLNINLRDSQGNIRPEVFADFARATQNLSRAEQQRAAAIVFGTDALRTQALIGRQGIAGLRETQAALERNGAAAELAGAQAQGLSGKISALSSNLETLGTLLGTLTLGPLSAFVEEINKAVTGINEFLILAGEIGGGVKQIGKEATDATPGLQRFFNIVKNTATSRIRGALVPTPVRAAGVAGGLIGSGARRVGLLPEAKKTADDARKARVEVVALFKTLGEGPLRNDALQPVVNQLQALADKLAKGDANAQALSRAIRGVLKDIERTGRVPTIVEIETKIDPESRRKGGDAAHQFLDGIRGTFPEFAQVAEDAMDIFGAAANNRITTLDLGGNVGRTFSGDLATQIAQAEAAGAGDATLLALLNKQLAEAKKRQALIEAKARAGQLEKPQERIQAEANKVTQIQNQIDDILDKQKSDAESAKRDAESKAKDIATETAKRDQAILDIFSSNRQKAQNKLTIAQATEGLDDDIKTSIFLKKLVLLQIKRIRDRIKTAELRKDALAEEAQILLGLNLSIAALKKERQATLRDQIRTGIELDIEFAQTTENVALERRSRNRLIKSLQDEIDRIKKQKRLTIEQKNHLKELRNEIAEQRQALKEIDQENKNLFAQLSFNFLTTQQGFAANLLGNLLPLGAIGGTVAGNLASAAGGGGGGGTGSAPGKGATFPGALLPQEHGRGGGPASAVRESSRLAQAESQSGFTSAQAATLIHLTKQMVQILAALDGRSKHPENRRHQRATDAALDIRH